MNEFDQEVDESLRYEAFTKIFAKLWKPALCLGFVFLIGITGFIHYSNQRREDLVRLSNNYIKILENPSNLSSIWTEAKLTDLQSGLPYEVYLMLAKARWYSSRDAEKAEALYSQLLRSKHIPSELIDIVEFNFALLCFKLKKDSQALPLLYAISNHDTPLSYSANELLFLYYISHHHKKEADAILNALQQDHAAPKELITRLTLFNHLPNTNS